MKAGWEVKALGDVCEVVGGGTPSKDRPDFYNGTIPWATIRDMGFDLLETTDHSISQVGLDASSSKLIPKGEVVMASRVGLGKVCILAQDTAINQDLRAVIPKQANRLDRRFLFHWFVSMSDYIEAAGTGATVKGVKLPFIKGLPIPLPPLEEQKQIVAVLDAAFEGLTRARTHVKTNLQNARELFENYREHYLSPENCQGWSHEKLEDLITIKHGFAFKSAFFTDGGQYAVLTPGNYHETGGFRDRGNKQRFYSGEFPEEFLLKKGDLLMAMTEQAPGLLGSCMVVPEDDGFLHNQRLGLINPKDGVAWSEDYFSQVFNLRSFRKALSDTCSGATVRHTSPRRILAEYIPYSSDLVELAAAAAELNEREQDAQTLQSHYRLKLQDLDDLRQSLLQKAFAGELT